MRFPQMHIADSALLRIKTIADAARAMQGGQVAAAGQAVDQAVRTPPAATPAPEGLEMDVVYRSLGL